MVFRPRGLRSAKGVTRIIRDGYGSKWWQHAKGILDRDGTCVQCQKEGRVSSGPLHTHHIKPLSRGGTTTKANMILLCEYHHQQRHSHSVKNN